MVSQLSSTSNHGESLLVSHDLTSSILVFEMLHALAISANPCLAVSCVSAFTQNIPQKLFRFFSTNLMAISLFPDPPIPQQTKIGRSRLSSLRRTRCSLIFCKIDSRPVNRGVEGRGTSQCLFPTGRQITLLIVLTKLLYTGVAD